MADRRDLIVAVGRATRIEVEGRFERHVRPTGEASRAAAQEVDGVRPERSPSSTWDARNPPWSSRPTDTWSTRSKG